MKINQKIRYGMACLVELAKSSSEFMDANEIAKKQIIPQAYAHKVLQAMAHSGLVLGVKGAGYKIQKPLSDITAYDVISSLTKEETQLTAFDGMGQALEIRINQTLSTVVLSDLLLVR